ncbi:MAG: hypothetical protein JW713_05820 [Pontiellaceae bacterium]|nr:hypothetical protein [Pontiellaceae bacterium]
MSRVVERHSIMDGPHPEMLEQIEHRLKAMPETAVLAFIEFIEARFLMYQAECGASNEHLQRIEGRKQELKDLKDSIVQARSPQADGFDGATYTNEGAIQ